MASNNLVKFAALGGAGYLAYEWWKNNQTAAPVPATSGTQAAGSPSGNQPGAAASGGNAPASAAVYSGPSLDQMFAALVAAIKTGQVGGDGAVTCPGLGATRGDLHSPTGATGTTAVPTRTVRIAGGPTGATSPSPVSNCSTPLATPDVWGWYLVNRAGVGVSAAPSPADAFPGADLSVPITAAQYWAGVAPLLKVQLGMAGLGLFARSFRRSGFGFYVGPRGLRGLGSDFQGPPLIDPTGALVDTTDADYQRAAAGAGFDTNNGSYEVDAATGAVKFTPVKVPASASKPLIAGVSNGVLAVAGGALVLLVGVAAGRR